MSVSWAFLHQASALAPDVTRESFQYTDAGVFRSKGSPQLLFCGSTERA